MRRGFLWTLRHTVESQTVKNVNRKSDNSNEKRQAAGICMLPRYELNRVKPNGMVIEAATLVKLCQKQQRERNETWEWENRIEKKAKEIELPRPSFYPSIPGNAIMTLLWLHPWARCTINCSVEDRQDVDFVLDRCCQAIGRCRAQPLPGIWSVRIRGNLYNLSPQTCFLTTLAFWLRSSVVSVLNSLTTIMEAQPPLLVI